MMCTGRLVFHVVKILLNYLQVVVSPPAPPLFSDTSFKFFSVFNICAVLHIVIIVFLIMRMDLFSYLQISSP